MTDVTTTTVQPLLDYFDRLIPLSKEEKDLVRAKFHPHLFIKKQFALQHGQVCEYFDFVVRGCLRLYMVDNNGVYHILQFATENYWILDLTSFHKKTPAKLNIDALEDTVVLRINHADLIDLYLKHQSSIEFSVCFWRTILCFNSSAWPNFLALQRKNVISYFWRPIPTCLTAFLKSKLLLIWALRRSS